MLRQTLSEDDHNRKPANRAEERFGDEVIGSGHRATSVRLGGLHLHRHPVSEIQQVGGGHLLIQFQALGDGVQVVLQFAHRDRGLQGELGISGKLAGLNAQLQPL